ncbi:hypothetical protein CLFE_042990 [Clostridium felsineum DSM 794]|nr:hypothetical protein CLFE_042990 [Clostridium felsineum DSM 794]
MGRIHKVYEFVKDEAVKYNREEGIIAYYI